MKKKTIGMLLMALSAFMLAYAIILMKIIPQVTRLLPGHVAIWRFSIAAPLLWLIAWFRRSSSRSIPDQPVKLLGLGGVYAVASFSALFALDRLPSSLYVIIVFMYPSLVVLYALILGKAVPKFYWLGLPMTLIGLFLVAFEFGSDISVDLVGLFITLINAVAMAIYMIWSENLLSNSRNRSSSTTWVLTGGMLFGLIMIPFFGLQTPESTIGWILLLALGIFGTLLPILVINYALQLMGAARGSVILTLQPILAVLFSTIFLDEVLAVQQWLGGILVIVAILMFQLSADRNGKEGLRN